MIFLNDFTVFLCFWTKSRGLGQSQARPSPTFGFWPSSEICEAKARWSQAKAGAFRPSRSRQITTVLFRPNVHGLWHVTLSVHRHRSSQIAMTRDNTKKCSFRQVFTRFQGVLSQAEVDHSPKFLYTLFRYLATCSEYITHAMFFF